MGLLCISFNESMAADSPALFKNIFGCQELKGKLVSSIRCSGHQVTSEVVWIGLRFEALAVVEV